MKNPRVLAPVAILVAAFVVGTLFGSRWVARAAPADPAPAPTNEELGLPAFQPQDAKVDREAFRLSATAVDRADLLACRNLDAKPRAPRAVTAAEFARAMTGVWVARNRSVHGIPVEMDTAYYIQFGPSGGTAVLIDRNNLRQGVFAKSLRATMTTAKPARALTQTFVNCRYEFIDQYVKVSDTVPVASLLTATATQLKRPAAAKPPSLEEAWRGMISTGYFSRRSGVTAGARIGDGKRFALLVNGARVSETEIEKGLGVAAGQEYQLPMVVGGFFKATLNSTPGENGMAAVRLNIDAEYAGTGVNMNPDAVTKGTERGTFMGEGQGFASFGKEMYNTSDCGDKNGLTEPGMIFERLVIK